MSTQSNVNSIATAYDLVAADYSELQRTALASKPFDRAMLCAFADVVKEEPGGRVADLGCGPGHVTAFLDDQGLDVFGVDLSRKMVVTAQSDYPELQFLVGSLNELDLEDRSLRGITAWYSIIHTPPQELPATLSEFSRVLEDGRYAIMAFQVGNERRRIEKGYGHSISLDAYRLDPSTVTDLLESAGLFVQARLVRQPDNSENTPQAYLLAQKART
jgi:ubiquinone/menaquinone biosynthesis C-methylase UbiE